MFSISILRGLVKKEDSAKGERTTGGKDSRTSISVTQSRLWDELNHWKEVTSQTGMTSHSEGGVRA